MNRKIWWVISTKYALFLSTIFRSGTRCQKHQFFNKAVNKGCLFTLPLQRLGGLAIPNHFCGKKELCTHILDSEALQYTQLEYVKGPRFANMWLLFSMYTVQLSM